MIRKSQKLRNRMARAGEGDRTVTTKMPKHLFSGKRGSGTNSRRWKTLLSFCCFLPQSPALSVLLWCFFFLIVRQKKKRTKKEKSIAHLNSIAWLHEDRWQKILGPANLFLNRLLIDFGKGLSFLDNIFQPRLQTVLSLFHYFSCLGRLSKHLKDRKKMFLQAVVFGVEFFNQKREKVKAQNGLR